MVNELVSRYVRVKICDKIFDKNTFSGVLVAADNTWLKLGNDAFDGEKTFTKYTYIPISNVVSVVEN